MTENTDYKLANIQKRELKLRGLRHEILISESEKALDMILEAPSPATLVQSFPDQDLYYLMHKIGPYDFIPILAMARSEQWEYILDVETWDNDRLDLDYMTKTFDILFQADPQRLLRWVIKEKPDYFEFYLFKNMEIFVREHDELPPEDFDDYITIDDKFYFRFPEKPEDMDEDLPEQRNNPEAWELIEKMVKAVAQMDLSVYHGLLLETASTLPAETEEEHFRLKNMRLAEKGFLPAHEALGIYQPTKLSSLRKRPEKDRFTSEPFDPDIPLPPQFFSQFIEGDDLFVKSLKLLDPEFILHLESELAALINKIISADKIKLRSKEDLEKAISKACDYLNLGLEVILKGEKKPELAIGVIREYFLEDIFRSGSRAGLKLKTKAFNWFRQSFMNKNDLPLSFLGETYLGVIGGLFLDRPLYYDNYAAGKLYRDFKSISDIIVTSKALEQIIALDKVLGLIDADINSFEQGVLTFKTLILTLWAKDRLKLAPDLEPIDTIIFKKFFIALFSKSDSKQSPGIQLQDLALWISEVTDVNETDFDNAFSQVLSDLIKELEEEYSLVNPENIDPRFIPHFLLKRTDKK
ncbi:MAG: hypothetical protein HOG03_23705 [Desulfobacula sp.]|jgi:hypothetical protein|uniref:DUF6178 family protein n=1 Tax=Desulfobacula sp. TaxID=2593537 RepID=UPI001D8BCAA8|nr:hypothetical protein [Desulfobacula sp.]MBT3487057.1 hypothetical protein [Desulfobacula sp.]MBT3807570.1 hypothetical protein [Desulfobacula sp.]MBT4026790.1 hypothetical protein [Desulfobacula sp.]MBT4199053.1 hypothetical protein [Desulfobacula sp.]